ncbi:DUF4282 domain-containing protein [Candidatus Poribacteria bacterium]|nr:DUF4282 domain-containing protein [Candidatus Poribacteria bacterium]
MKDYLKLDNYLIPKIVPPIYRYGLIFCVIMGLIEIVDYSMGNGNQQSWSDALLSGILWIIIIPVILRIICEAMLILIENNQILTDIKTKINSQDDNQNQIEKVM